MARRFFYFAVSLISASAAGDWNTNCTYEKQTFCEAYVDEAGMNYCLFKHYPELSNWCRGKREVVELVTLPAERVNWCRAEIQTHCEGVPNSGGRLTRCLMDHVNELGIQCRAGTHWVQMLAADARANSPLRRKTVMAKAKAGKKLQRALESQLDMHDACSFEIYFYCREKSENLKSLNRCLLKNRKKARNDCRQAIQASMAFGRLVR